MMCEVHYEKATREVEFEQTTSADPDVNLDIVLKSYGANKKNEISHDDRFFQVTHGYTHVQGHSQWREWV